jgi:hypothetical protein
LVARPCLLCTDGECDEKYPGSRIGRHVPDTFGQHRLVR